MGTNELHHCLRTLDLESGASLLDAKRSYRELVKVWHPDRFAHDPDLQRRAQEKLKQINLAYELLEKFLENPEPHSVPPQQERSEARREELFFQGQNLFFGKGVVKDSAKAAALLRESADMGLAASQFLLGHLYYSGDGVPKSQDDAGIWWTKASEQLHPHAQYALGRLYHDGFKSDLLAKALKRTVNWEFGGAKIEAYKWLNLAITYGAGRQAGVLIEQVSICLSGQQRMQARQRAVPFYPKYPKDSSEAVIGRLFDRLLEEFKSPAHKTIAEFYSKCLTQTGNLEQFRGNFCKAGVAELRNEFLGNRFAQVSGFFKGASSAWSSNRSSADWGVYLFGYCFATHYEFLSDAFVQRRENAINQVWLNVMEL